MTRVVLARSARAALQGLPYPLAEAVTESLSQLERDPQTGYPLRGRLRGLYSLRVGVYRVVYELRENAETVRVVAIRHREEAYRSDPR